MRIDTLSLSNFRNYTQLNLAFRPGINLFMGANGSGKTSILEGLNVAAACFFGEQESKMQRTIELSEVRLFMQNNRLLRSEKTSVLASSELLGGEWGRNYNALTKKNDNNQIRLAANYGEAIIAGFARAEDRTIAPLIAYYSTQRLFKDAYQSAKQKYDAALGRRNGYLQCLKNNAIKGTLLGWLGNAVTRRANRHIQDIEATDWVLENVEQAIKITLAHFIRDFKAEALKIYQDPDYDFELFIQLSPDNALPLNYYSDGLRNLLYLIIDLVWRASQLNPWLSWAELAKLQTGCVTIDEVDLHLHPKWQAQIMGLLQQLFPKIQFFITTHSPTVLGNFNLRMTEAGDNLDALFLLEGQDCTRIDEPFYGKDINAILNNPMNAKPRAEAVWEQIQRFYSLVSEPELSAENTEEAQAIAEQLGAILPGTDPDMLRIKNISQRLKF